MAYFTCCDNEIWRKYVLHLRFLGDTGGPPINAFQFLDD